jgi:hypothetical protein
MYTLGEAAKATGKQKSTITNAIKTGRISAFKNSKGEWSIDPAELHRVYRAVSSDSFKNGKTERYETPDRTGVLEAKIEALQQLLDREREINRDLQQDRDHWRQQATALLSDQREKAPRKPTEGLLGRWVGWNAGKG